MIITKHDLCSNTAKLNLNELIETAKIAVSRCRRDCEQYLQAIQEKQMIPKADKWRHSYGIAQAADDLSRASKDLAIATNTLHYLTQAEDRNEINVAK